MVFLKIIRSFVNRFKNKDSFKLFSKIFLNSQNRGKHRDSENIEDFRKVQRQIYYKIGKASLKPFSLKK